MLKDIRVKKLKLANTCLQISKHMANLNNMLYDIRTLDLWLECPIVNQSLFFNPKHNTLVMLSNDYHMISKWLTKHRGE